MRAPLHSFPHRSNATLRLIQCIAIAVLAASCGSSDPLDEIRQMHAAGDFKGSIEPLRELVAERKGDPEILYFYGRALVLAGETGLAEWSLREAMKDPEWKVRAGHQLAYGALATHNYPAAIETLSELLELEPDNVEFLSLRAVAYAHSRLYYEEAIVDARRALELDPSNLDAMEPLIFALLSLERSEDAREAIEQLGRLIDESDLGEQTTAWHCTTTAIFAGEDGKPDLAEERWTRCLEAYPGHPNVVTKALQHYDGKQDYARSLEIARRAHEAKPDSHDHRVNLAFRLVSAERSDEAEAVLRQATETDDPAVASIAWFDLGKFYQDQGDNTKAWQHMERAVASAREAGEPRPQILFEYADALLLAGELDRALAVSAELPLPAYRELIQARVAQEKGEHAEALEHFEEAFQLWPDNPWGRYYAALSAEQLGDFDLAIEYYRYAIRINPGATDARQRLAQLHRKEGRFLEAVTMLLLETDSMPLDVEGELLSIYLWARVGRDEPVDVLLEHYRVAVPQLYGTALAKAGEGWSDLRGPTVGFERLRAAKGLRLEVPEHEDALRMLVRLASASQQLDAIQDAVDARAAAGPESAKAFEIQGLWLELAGKPEAEVRAAYSRAVELDPEQPRALAALAGLMQESNLEEALRLYERAAKADPDDAEIPLAAGRALIQAGRLDEARARLDALLEQHPFEGSAAFELARLDVEQDRVTDESLERAKRAARFAPRPGTWDLLSSVYRARGETELADQAKKRAELMRERISRTPG